MSWDSSKIIMPKHYGYDCHNLIQTNPMIDYKYEHRWPHALVFDDPLMFEQCIDESLRTRVEQVILSQKKPPLPPPILQQETILDAHQILDMISHSDSHQSEQVKMVDLEQRVKENEPTTSYSVRNSPQKSAGKLSGLLFVKRDLGITF